jgi:hypothetical protein
MGNFIVSYDLNRPTPTHKQMDDHLGKIGVTRGRVLETVWYVAYSGTTAELRDYLLQILDQNDRLLVVRCSDAAWQNLLIQGDSLVQAWNQNA